MKPEELLTAFGPAPEDITIDSIMPFSYPVSIATGSDGDQATVTNNNVAAFPCTSADFVTVLSTRTHASLGTTANGINPDSSPRPRQLQASGCSQGEGRRFFYAEAKMAPVRVLTFVLAAAFAGAAHATEPTAGDRAAVQKIIADQVRAWNRGDASAFSRHLRPDIIMTNTVGMVAVGPAAFEAQHKLILSSIYKNSNLTEAIAQIRALSGTVIIVDVDASLAGSSWLAPGALIKDGTMFARLEQMFVKDSGGWGIAS